MSVAGKPADGPCLVIGYDRTDSALIEGAERHGAQGIVVGHEHHSRLHRALGTVTSGLLGASPVPVIAIPPAAADSGRAPLAHTG